MPLKISRLPDQTALGNQPATSLLVTAMGEIPKKSQIIFSIFTCFVSEHQAIRIFIKRVMLLNNAFYLEFISFTLIVGCLSQDMLINGTYFNKVLFTDRCRRRTCCPSLLHLADRLYTVIHKTQKTKMKVLVSEQYFSYSKVWVINECS